MAAVQQGNLNDWYAATFIGTLNAILSNEAYHSELMTANDLVSAVELIALAAINRISVKTTDFSTVTPAITVFTGQKLQNAAVVIPVVPPVKVFNPPGIVKNADGSQA